MAEKEQDIHQLSHREVEVALLAAQGLTDKEIAERLSLSPGTLRTYWERARTKLDARSRSHVIAKLLHTNFQGTQKELEAEMQLLKLFLASSSEYAMIITDAEGIIQVWNPGIERVLGYKADEWVGQHLRIIYTEEERLAKKAERDMAESQYNGPVLQLGWHSKKDGIFWGRGTLFALWDGELQGFGKVLGDATETKELVDTMKGLSDRLDSLLRQSG
ncbi:MAG: LuxR C-terminal-related transcriptional regulator [Fimbriimonas sp.]